MIKTQIIEALKEDYGFRQEVRYILGVLDLEDYFDNIEEALSEIASNNIDLEKTKKKD